nr:hypothetical protein [Clostridium aestuarii]
MSAIILLYAGAIILGILESGISHMTLLLIIGIVLAVLGSVIYTLIERIKEIKEEDEDDISKY